MQVSLFMLDDELQDLCFLSSGCDGKFTLVNVQQSGLCVMDWPGFQLSPVSAGGSRAGVPVKNLFPSSLPQHSGPHICIEWLLTQSQRSREGGSCFLKTPFINQEVQGSKEAATFLTQGPLWCHFLSSHPCALKPFLWYGWLQSFAWSSLRLHGSVCASESPSVYRVDVLATNGWIQSGWVTWEGAKL